MTHSWSVLPILIAAMSFSSVTVAVDIDRLWLAKKDRRYYLDLRDAALAVEATERCHEVLRGTLDDDNSRDETRVYRILCRDSGGRSYTELVDGDSLELFSSREDAPPPETDRERELRLAAEAQARAEAEAEVERLATEQAQAEAEAAREAEEQAQREQALKEQQAREAARRHAILEEACRAELLAKTSMMMNLSWLTEKPVMEELDNGQLRFHTEFDAENMWGKRLEYKAVCTISTPAELVVLISAR